MTSKISGRVQPLAKPYKPELKSGDKIVKPGRGGFTHFMAKGETLTVCNLDSTSWLKAETVTETGEVNCPRCAELLKAGIRKVEKREAKSDASTPAAASSNGEAKVDPKPSGRKRKSEAPVQDAVEGTVTVASGDAA